MDYTLLYEQSKDLLNDYKDYKSNKKFKDYNDAKFKSEMTNTYSYLTSNAKSIFELCLTGKMDLQILYYMIKQAKNIKNDTITSHEASIKVGEKLVDKIIKPSLNKDKE
jgi:hypothetical protein